MKLVRGFVMVEGYGNLLMILLGESVMSGMVFVMAEVLGG